MLKFENTAASYETYAEYVTARRATRHDVLPETLWTALKTTESVCNPRMAEGFAEFEAACEVKDLSLRSDPAKPAYIVRTV
jgi:hypothetical protein